MRALDKFHQTDRQPLAFLELLTEPKIYLVKHEMKSHAIYVEFVKLVYLINFIGNINTNNKHKKCLLNSI